jgi:CRISP-associated protein Cas1
MVTLYLLEQGCSVSLEGENLRVTKDGDLRQRVALPTLRQILVFGQSQISTAVVRSCLQQEINIGYLSRQGHCYGRLLPTQSKQRNFNRLQLNLGAESRLQISRVIVQAKIQNCRVMLLRSQRRNTQLDFEQTCQYLDYFAKKALQAESLDQLRGFEGAAAAQYFPALGSVLNNKDFTLLQRSRRPPLNPINAMLSFGYQVLWNHVLAQIELQGLDAYEGVFHAANDRHPSLASDLIEEFRSPIIDSLVLWLVNTHVMNADIHFDFHEGGCYLNEDGRRIYLKYFIQRMNENIQVENKSQPRWSLIEQQVENYKEFLLNPVNGYQNYRIR